MLLFEDKEYFLDTQYKFDYSSGFTEIEDNTNEIPIIKEYDKIYKNNRSLFTSKMKKTLTKEKCY